MKKFQLCLFRFILVSFLLAFSSFYAEGHHPFRSYIEHHFYFQPNSNNLDCALTLTFFNEALREEIKFVDTNGDGRVTEKEANVRLQQLEDQLNGQLLVVCNGKPVQAVSLYPPEANSGQNVGMGPTPMVYSFYFFVRLPKPIRSVGELLIEDLLFPEIPAALVWKANGIDNLAENRSPVFSRSTDSHPRQFLLVTNNVGGGNAGLYAANQSLNSMNYSKWIGLLAITAVLVTGVLIKTKGRAIS